MEATKQVEGYFGPKQVTREEFIKRWTGHFTEFFNLAEASSEYEEMKRMQERMAALAGRKWDKIK